MSEIYEKEPQTWEPDVGDDRDRKLVSERIEGVPLLSEQMRGDYRAQWQVIQTGFVDDPRHAVERAEALIDRCIHELSAWSHREDVSTEDLRIALQRYRAVFERLLAM
jgi:hypothetical protein